MIYVSVATGVGGGLILGGDLYRGIHAAPARSATCSFPIPRGIPAGAAFPAAWSPSPRAEHGQVRHGAHPRGAESRILDHAGTVARIDMVAVGKALGEDDPLAIEVVERGAEYLGRMFQSLYQIFDINIFVYGAA